MNKKIGAIAAATLLALSSVGGVIGAAQPVNQDQCMPKPVCLDLNIRPGLEAGLGLDTHLGFQTKLGLGLVVENLVRGSASMIFAAQPHFNFCSPCQVYSPTQFCGTEFELLSYFPFGRGVGIGYQWANILPSNGGMFEKEGVVIKYKDRPGTPLVWEFGINRYSNSGNLELELNWLLEF